jgi:hypothetical protein
LLDTFDGHRLSVIGRAMRGSSLTGCFDDLLRRLASMTCCQGLRSRCFITSIL